MSRILSCVCGVVCFALVAAGAPDPLQTYTVKDHLRHAWSNELVHFPIAYRALKMPKTLTLRDADGQSVPCQVNGLGRSGLMITGTVWTVISVPPKGSVTLHLTPGDPAPSALKLAAQGQDYVLHNEFMAVRLPRLPGSLTLPADLNTLPAPLLAVSGPDAAVWLGQGIWTHTGGALQVKEATTTVLEEGPVRVTIRYRLTFTDGRFYQADISLGARQECALFTDDSNVDSPDTAFRFSFQPGLGADRTYWRNSYFADATKGLSPGPIAFDTEQVLFAMRPWYFWWLKDKAGWAGFYKDGAEPFVGVIGLRPSHWSPYGWDGFDRTELPVTARPGGQLDLTLALLAWTRQVTTNALTPLEAVAHAYSQEVLAGTDTPKVYPLHRELAFTVGTVAEHVTKDETQAKLRLQLVKISQFPLDEVKDYAFDFKPANPNRKHPFLLFSQADMDRVRRQARSIPAVEEEVSKATNYIIRVGGDTLVAKIRKEPDGWLSFYRENYIANGLNQYLPQAYASSGEPMFGAMLAAGLKGTARDNIANVLEKPWRPDLGSFAHVYPGNWTTLLFSFDSLADTDYLTADEKKEVDASLVFGAHVLAHPDYWTPERGLSSANPNMTALVRLPRALMALYLEGHPEADAWLKVAETELQREIKEFIAPGGAWIECPGYQGASLDPMFPIMQALKNVKGRDYFADPRMKETMDYYGFLLTPPDRRFPPGSTNNVPSPMIFPAIGDMWAGTTSPFIGWMAKSVSQSDPAQSARQAYFWKQQLFPYGSMYTPYTVVLTDPELPAAPPAELSRGFPGFGSVMRTSWTEPKASYLAHRTGPYIHHYHQDFNEIVYYAKGAPLCLDFGNLYQPFQRGEAWYHNRVSFTKAGVGPGITATETGKLIDVRTLPRTLDYSYGQSTGNEGQQDHRHVLLVKSDDPLGANYVILRDRTEDGPTKPMFYFNLFCLSKDPQITGNLVHFPGQFGVDLDVSILAPAAPQIEMDHWDWKQYIGRWGNFTEEQFGIRIAKQGSTEDYFTVLYPRAEGQEPAKVTALADGRAVAVRHMEGTDVVLLSPGQAISVTVDDVRLSGEIAFVRRYTNGDVRLAIVKGPEALAALGPWEIKSSGPVAIHVRGKVLEGEGSGDAHDVQLVLPPDFGSPEVMLDGKPAKAKREGNALTIALPDGAHLFTVTGK